ncbi:DUF4050 domain-containing protein [Aspergillus undulatus]|uniref:DUF4050 domain-containing protein n=1 Tax=Aspergillus undulatus TaxID=1810928 RepID=UPI003CCD48E5
MSSEARDEAIREAKRYVRDVVKNDWSFEFSTKPGAPPPVYPANPEPSEVDEWRQREYDTSGSELEPQFSPVGSPGPDGFNDGDEGALLEERARQNERRRKRRRQMEEEMSWNEGLRTWVERRDAWSGALSREKVESWKERHRPVVDDDAAEGNGDAAEDHATDFPDTDDEHSPAPRASDPSVVPGAEDMSNLAAKTEALKINGTKEDKTTAPPQQSKHNQENECKPELTAQAVPEIPVLPQPLSSSSAIPATSPSDSSSSSPSSPPPADTFHDPQIPVVPSLISKSNPIRASITPAMYPSIYSKVVIQGLTPTVPINLADMTKAMVQGWKADGQWPPRPQNLVLTNDAIVRPSPTSATKHPDTPAIPESAADRDKNAPSSPESKRKSGIASTVRKVLHFSGFHPHPFHRRGSSSQHQSPPEDLANPGAGDASPASGTGTGIHEQGDK